MTTKRKNTINNTGLKLANYMKGLTESKRRNEIIHTLESSRKPSVKKFLGKFKIELFESVKIWMLTPEVVSELIPLQQGIFDLVIFDEASQMFVEKGIPSIFRAKKVVIAGDSKQLRPTRLFSGRFEKNPEEIFVAEELVSNIETSLLSMVINFYKHNKGKSANETRYSYFRIFFTEKLIILLDECGINKSMNERECYENSDKDLVRFVSFSEYKELKDLLSLDFKKFSDVIDGYKDDSKLICVPFENEIIAEYRYKNALDKAKVSLSNVSQQRTVFEEQLRRIGLNYA